MVPPNLLTLPREIRDKILRYCPVIGVMYIPEIDGGGYPYPGWVAYLFDRPNRFMGYLETPRALEQLLQCCKMLYAEGLPILYGENVLYFSSPYRMRKSLLRRKNICAEVKHVFAGSAPDNTFVHDMLTAMPKLKTFDMLHGKSTEREDQAIVQQIKALYRYSDSLVECIAATSRRIELGLLLCRRHSEEPYLQPLVSVFPTT